MLQRFKFSCLLWAGLCVPLASTARAGSLDLSSQYGWSFEWDSAPGSASAGLGLILETSGDGVIGLKKVAPFYLPPDSDGNFLGINILIRQTSAKALDYPTIQIVADIIANNTGTAFGAFKFDIVGGFTNAGGSPKFNTSSLNFKTTPFDDKTLLADDTTLYASGGLLASGQTLFGGQDGSSLSINASPSASNLPLQLFILEEQAMIPLPASVTLALFGVSTLGAMSSFRRLLRRI